MTCNCKELWKYFETGTKRIRKYKINNKGKLIRISKKNEEIIIKWRDNGCGYLMNTQGYIHRVVYKNFIGPLLEKQEIDHIDGNKLNNCVCNLRQVSSSENKKNPATNKPLTEEHKEKIKKALKGKKRPDLAGKAPWNKGKKMSEEQKEKIRQTLLNKNKV